jgi:hypothetical protein
MYVHYHNVIQKHFNKDKITQIKQVLLYIKNNNVKKFNTKNE